MFVSIASALFKVSIAFMLIAGGYHLLTKKYVQWEKFYFIFGKKGSGKSTTLTKIAMKYMRKGYKVYSTYDIPGSYLFDPHDIGHYAFDEYSIVLVDEASLLWSNRNFKTMDPKVIEWVQQLRKQHCRLYMASVAFDIDLKLRDQADYLYLMNKYFRVFSICRQIRKYPDLIQANEYSEARITDQLELVFPLMPGAVMISFIPKWSKYYDTYYNTLRLDSINDRTTQVPLLEKNKKKNKISLKKYLPVKDHKG